MSNIPSNAMPHAGGAPRHDEHSGTATVPTATRNESPSAGFTAGGAPRAQQSVSQFADTSGSLRQPERNRGDGDSRQRSGSLMEKARENKAGIAFGVAVGAIAATALPLMFSGKKKSGGRHDIDNSAGLYVEDRGRHELDSRQGVVTADARTVGATSTSPVASSGDQTTTTGQKRGTAAA